MNVYCPFLLFSEDENEARQCSTFDDDEWISINESRNSSDVIEAIKKYHSKENIKRFDEIITVSTTELFDTKQIELLQLALLELLHKKEIVIETLPTSNIRIGIHQDFDTYHLWNWVKWEKEGFCIPPIVIGTDDPGVFSTNVYNEFANIYCHLTSTCKMSHNEVMQLIESLDKNGQIYSFYKDDLKIK